jgi:hypothetical protein
MMDMLRGAIEKVRRGRYSGLRTAGDLTWALSDRKLFGQALYYEKLVDEVIPGNAMTSICHYQAGPCTPMEMHSLAHVHNWQFRLSN